MIEYTNPRLIEFPNEDNELSREENLELDLQLQEFNRRWRSEKYVIWKVIQREKKLGHVPDVFDLYTSGKFTNPEFDLIEKSGASRWLLNGLVSLIRQSTSTTSTQSAQPTQLCDIVRLSARTSSTSPPSSSEAAA